MAKKERDLQITKIRRKFERQIKEEEREAIQK